MSPSKKVLLLAQKEVPSLDELTINMSGVEQNIQIQISGRIGLPQNKRCMHQNNATHFVEIVSKVRLKMKVIKWIIGIAIYNKLIKLSTMSHLQNMTCPNQHPASMVCLNSSCNSPPFHCTNPNCPSSSLHFKCKLMQTKAVNEYLFNWKAYISEQGRQFMSRVDKIYTNLRTRLQKQQKLFSIYCADMFVGKDYSKLIHFIENKDMKQISSTLIASALNCITDKSCTRRFNAFNLSQMQAIDQSMSQLFNQIQSVYRSKEVQVVQVQKIKRCSSAVLQRQGKKSNNAVSINKNSNKSSVVSSRSRNQSQFNKIEDTIYSLKLDLTFPKQINSNIVSEASSINQLLTKKIHKYHLAYRASQHQFSINQFYSKMALTTRHLKENQIKHKQNYQIASLILVKTEYGKILGGYTPLEWIQAKRSHIDSDEQDNPELSQRNKNKQKMKADCSASTVLFALDLMEKYTLNKPDQAIYCGSKSIGFGKGDLKIVDRANEVRKSYCRFPQSYNWSIKPYVDWTKSGMQLSGARYSIYFKIVQWQAFILQY